MITEIGKAGKFAAILTSSFVLLVTIGIILHIRKMTDYPDIRDYGNIQGVIIRVKPERSSAFVIFNDGRKAFLIDSENYLHNTYALNQFLQKGDSIVCKGESDSLYIYRDHKVYYYILGKRIGK
jgi:hypothetical protein